MTRALVLACLAILAIAAAPVSAAVASGRIGFSIATKVPESDVDVDAGAGDFGPAVALSEGGAVLLVPDASKGIAAVRLRADGALKSPFGSGGVARVPVPGGAFDAQQLLRRPDAGCSPSAAGRRRRAIATACPSRASDAVTAGRQVA